MSNSIELRGNQVKAVNATRENAKGQIQSPTGSGKTIVQAERTSDFLVDGFKVVVVSAPRISLCNQLAGEYAKYLGGTKGINNSMYNAILVHSGDSVEIADENMEGPELRALLRTTKTNIKSTSFTTEFVKEVKSSKDQNKPLVVFSTYHSTKEKVADVLNAMGITVACHMNDEAHYLTTEKFSQIFEDFRPETQYFFTATPIKSDSNNGRGMNNVERFGEVIYAMTFREAVDLGLILDVDVQVINSLAEEAVTQDQLDEQIGEVVDKAFAKVESTYEGLGAKMMVTTRGSNHIRTFLNSDEFDGLVADGVEVFTVHSNNDIMTHNGEMISRGQFDKLKNRMGKDPEVKMIIMHYDILAEGIDIPGLLGVLILRQLETAKFMQTVGRVVRLYRDNPALKQKGLVMFPRVANEDMFASYMEMYKTLINEYNYSEEDLREQIVKGDGEPEGDDRREKEVKNLTPESVDLMLEINPVKYEFESVF